MKVVVNEKKRKRIVVNSLKIEGTLRLPLLLLFFHRHFGMRRFSLFLCHLTQSNIKSLLPSKTPLWCVKKLYTVRFSGGGVVCNQNNLIM